jgi:hypothetical protein
MTAALSVTDHDFYAFPLPLTVYSWNKIGVKCITFMPNGELSAKMQLVMQYCGSDNRFFRFDAPEHKQPTYAQVSRLFGCCTDLPEDEILITGDSDLSVFSDYFKQLESGQIHLVGVDLVPPEQYAICFVAAPVKTWREVMWVTPGTSYQKYLDDHLGPIECEHFRANQWAFDQGLIYRQLTRNNWPTVKHNRAIEPHAFATRRADRDGWPQTIPADIIDSHLPRPGYTDENWKKIFTLFSTMYPNEDLQWMEDYRNQYIKLI